MYNQFKTLKTISIILMLMLMILGMDNWNLRAIYADSAYTNYRFMQTENFEIIHHRYGEYLTQFLPVLAAKFSNNMEWVLKLWVFNVLAYIYLCFGLMIKRKEGFVPAIVLLIIYTTCQQRLFYDNSSQLITGIATVLLGFSYLTPYDIKSSKSILLNILAFALFVLGLLFHKGTMPIILFLLFFNALKGKFKPPSLYMLAVGFVFVFGISKLLPTSGYEGEFMKNLSFETLKSKGIKDYPLFAFVIPQLKSLYFFPFILFLAGSYYILKESFIKLLFYVIPALAIYCLYAIIFADWEGTMMMEKKAWPLFIPFVLPVVYYFVHTKKPSLKIYFSVFVVIFVWKGVKRIKNTASIFENRQNALIEMMNQTDILKAKKAIINGDNLSETTYLIPWAIPYETLILSHLKTPKNIIVIKNKKERLKEYNNEDTYLLGAPFCLYAYKDKLNPKFFKLKKGKYKRVNIIY